MNVKIVIGEGEASATTWLWNEVSSLYNSWFGIPAVGKLLLCGSEQAGRVSFARNIRKNTTEDDHVDEVILKNSKFLLQQVQKIRDTPIWEHGDAYAVIYVVDCTNLSLIEEARLDIEALLERFKLLTHVPFLIIATNSFGNGALSRARLLQTLKLEGCQDENDSQLSLVDVVSRPMHLFMTCMTSLQGIEASMKWLEENLH